MCDEDGVATERAGREVKRLRWDDIVSVSTRPVSGTEDLRIVVATEHDMMVLGLRPKRFGVLKPYESEECRAFMATVEKKVREREEELQRAGKLEFHYPAVFLAQARRRLRRARAWLVALLIPALTWPFIAFALILIARGYPPRVVPAVVGHLAQANHPVYRGLALAGAASAVFVLSVGLFGLFVRWDIWQRLRHGMPIILRTGGLLEIGTPPQRRLFPLDRVTLGVIAEQDCFLQLDTGERLRVDSRLVGWRVLCEELRRRLEMAGVSMRSPGLRTVPWRLVLAQMLTMGGSIGAYLLAKAAAAQMK